MLCVRPAGTVHAGVCRGQAHLRADRERGDALLGRAAVPCWQVCASERGERLCVRNNGSIHAQVLGCAPDRIVRRGPRICLTARHYAGGGARGQTTAPAGEYVQVSCGWVGLSGAAAAAVAADAAAAATVATCRTTAVPLIAMAWRLAGATACGCVRCVPRQRAARSRRAAPPQGATVAPEGMQFLQVSASWWHHTCGVTVDGVAVCWGANTNGQSFAPSGPGMHPRLREAHSLQDAEEAEEEEEGFLQVTTGRKFTCAIRVPAAERRSHAPPSLTLRRAAGPPSAVLGRCLALVA